MLRKNYVLGVGITNEKEERILEYLLLSLKMAGEKYFIVTPNPEILVYSHEHPHYKKILNEAKIALPDGIGVFLASALMGNPIAQRITGVDFMEEICKRSKERPITVGFLGGGKGVAERAAECLKEKYPWIDVGFVGEEWPVRGPVGRFPRPTASFTSFSAGARRGSSPKRTTLVEGAPTPATPNFTIDILFVAFGHPKQEEWIYENLDKLPVKVAMGVGGAFDYVSGRVKRAPFLIRAVGFEWLFRLIVEPWRWKRQLALPKFVWLVLREKLG